MVDCTTSHPSAGLECMANEVCASSKGCYYCIRIRDVVAAPISGLMTKAVDVALRYYVEDASSIQELCAQELLVNLVYLFCQMVNLHQSPLLDVRSWKKDKSVKLIHGVVVRFKSMWRANENLQLSRNLLLV